MAEGFLVLPLELRLIIYEDLLIRPDPVCDPLPDSITTCQCPSTDRYKLEWYRMWFSSNRWAQMHRHVLGHETRQLHAAVLRVNKQIYLEAIRLLYSKNRFQFAWNPARNKGHPPEFLERIGPARGALICHVRISLTIYRLPTFDHAAVGTSSRDNTLVKLGKVCPNITTLELVDHMGPRGTGGEADMCFWVPHCPWEDSSAAHGRVLQLEQSLEGSVPLEDFTLVVEYNDKTDRDDDMAFVAKWQEVIGLIIWGKSRIFLS